MTTTTKNKTLSIVFLFLAVFLFGYAGQAQTLGSLYTQNSSEQLYIEEGASLKSALEKVEQRYNVGLLYHSDIMEGLTVRQAGNLSLNIEEAISFLLKGTDLRFKALNPKTYGIYKNLVMIPQVMDSEIQQTVIGTVVDGETGEPLPGVNVLLKGMNRGTSTNVDGVFELEVESLQDTLIVSYIGYTTKDVPINGQSELTISLQPEAVLGEELVVVGYGTANREAVTGAVSVADLDKYREVPVNNILETVKGTVAGLNVGATNTAGAVAGLSIRGQNSISASNAPLIVVDGVIYNGSLGDIPTADIENLTVLKDASAAAVYGARSANGVILIESKKGGGINGKPKFNVNFSYGISNELEPLEVYDSDGYIQRILDIRRDNGQEADPNKITDYLFPIERENYEATPDHRPTFTDPYSIVGQIGHRLNSTVSMSNSTNNSSYYISASVGDQKGVVIKDTYQSFTGRVNIDSDPTDWFNLGIKSFYSLRDFSGATVDPSFGTHLSPYASLFNEDGSVITEPNGTPQLTNIFRSFPNEDLEKYNHLNAVITGTIKAPWVKGLSYKANFSNSWRWNYRNTFFDETTLGGRSKDGVGSRRHNNRKDILLDQIVSYKQTFAEKHNVDLTLLYSYEKRDFQNLSASATNFENTVLLDYGLENGQTQSVNTGGGESGSIGQMARATYTFNNKYSLTGTVRRDGFSAFSKNKKWGVFSSAGVNWNMDKESFMQNVNFIDKLAIRASYGSNGNQAIQPFSTLARVGTNKYVYAGDQTFTITQGITSLALNNLSWETTTGLNLGIDFEVFNNRITGTVDAYKTTTEDLLFTLQLPRTSGKSSILSNVGEIDNKGIEIQLHTDNILKRDFQWSSDFAFSLNRNEVVSITGLDNDGDGVEDDLVNSGIFIGRPLGTIYALNVIGMWQQDDEDNGTIMEGLRPGDYKIEDVPDADGQTDGLITSVQDRQFLGTTTPNFRWSWTNTFQYKDLSMMVYLYSIWGGNGHYQGAVNPQFDAFVANPNMNRPVYDYWTPENTNAKFPRPLYRSTASFQANKYFDRSFIKLQKISLTYNLSSLVKSQDINNLRLTASADNLFTYAPHWPGLDPETGVGLSRLARPSIRTYLLQLTFNF